MSVIINPVFLVFLGDECDMNLLELKEKVNEILESVREDGRQPEDIDVSVQIEMNTVDGWKSVCSNSVEIHYDNDACISGCVIAGDAERDPE